MASMVKKIFKSSISHIQKIRDVLRREIAIFFFDKKKNFSMDAIISQDKLRVLVWRLDAKWGDSIISSFFYREIKKHNGVEVIVITTPDLYTLYKDVYKADSVYVLNKRPAYSDLWKIARDIGHVDVVVHLTEAMKMKEMFFISLLSSKIVFSLDDDLYMVSHKMCIRTKEVTFRDKYKVILSELGVDNVDSSYIIPLHETGRDRFNIVVNPFGSTEKKSISIENINSLIKKLSEEFPDKRIGIISSPSTYDKALKMLARDGDNARAEVVGGVNSFYDAVEVINNADLIISVDTALVHVADGLGKKLVAIFPKNNEEFNPWLPTMRISNKIVFSHASGVDVNLNNYNEHELIEKVRLFYKL
ncbi:glycosyltransferase family 9 protein [Aeromonas jandaei]|uniref:glycosyltransferase family 9 protein n=1 Tax=Aeromonas jandaei TaxID=650 RepID=UPI00111693B5|nr:glycosyltransferase family 9 protein [Aeromonas jandaei]TNI04270.1 heptosyltransferase [Aeromonas jandaei]